ncbi:MAG TPA: SGNH/GDSL hydrolase family protein [Clostridiales bacterium]|nr:SGNH/GDSL hydrolase family protein [Clostridiales bacterium]
MGETKKIEEIDRNFIVPHSGISKFTYFDVTSGIFEISGFPWIESNRLIGNGSHINDAQNSRPESNEAQSNETQNNGAENNESGKNESFCRLDIRWLDKLSEGVKYLSWCTAGGVVRFASDSPAIAVKVELTSKGDMSHMPRSGSSGVDLYRGTGKNKIFVRAAMPGSGQDKYEAVFEGFSSELCEWTLNLPLYNGIKKLEIGLLPGTKLEKPSGYTIEKPVVFYGSSITQGGCASRPGNSYTHLICRWLDANMVNLGFSGSGRGEPEMAELISQIDMSAFVMDYDHNAPNLEHLEKTHENFFNIIRKAQPQLPVIFVTKPDFDREPETNRIRRKIIYNTFKNAVDNGDQNVYFVDGETLFGTEDRDACTVDGCHPNDLGFMRMAENIYPTIKKALRV